MAESFITKQSSFPLVNKSLIDDILFIVATIATSAVVIATGGILWYTYYLNNNTELLKQEVARLEEDLRPELINQLLNLDKKMSGLRILLDNHIITSNVFKLLEENTLTQVHFSSFSYFADARKIDLSGEAATYSTLSQQVRLFEALPQVERVDFGGLSKTSAGRITFKMGIVFKQSLIRFQGT